MSDHPADLHVRRVLHPDEQVNVRAVTGDAILAVTDRRVAIADEHRLMLDTPIEGLRRIQFDIERKRPATLVIVPESPAQQPQVLSVAPEQYEEVAQALAHIGLRLAEAG